MESKTNNRAILGVVALAVAVMIALGWSFAPSSVSSVSAANQESAGGATTEMLNYALNFKSASNLAVFGGTSVSDNGSEIRGVVGSTGDVVGISANAMSIGNAAANRRDLMDAFSAVDQLPCTQVSGDLGGQTFGPGVYCVGSATLAGRMTVDAGGDANARFVFRVDGSFTAEDGSSIVREGGAVATNVYVFASRSASIGANATIGSNVISREDVTVGNDSTVSGKVIGVSGDVTTNANIVAAGTGYIEICKELAQYDRRPVGTPFTFSVPAATNAAQQTVVVPAGAFGFPNCSAPIQVASGPVTVTEGVLADNAVVSITAIPASGLSSFDLALRQANLNVPTGDVNTEVVVYFRNQTTRTGTIEICKFGNDFDVTGFFNFTAIGATGGFSIPVGFCSGPITITLLQYNAGPSPQPTQQFTTWVNELAQPTYRCESATTFPTNALLAFVPDLQVTGVDPNSVPPGGPITAPNVDGCYAQIALNVGTGPANQTTVRFFNRSKPGRIKVCKITADETNIPVGTAFLFTISGTTWTSATNSTPVGATATFDVLAGPKSQGGFCAFAPNPMGLGWRVGDPVFVGEQGLNMATNTTTLPLDNPLIGGPGNGAGSTASYVRVSRIQLSPSGAPGGFYGTAASPVSVGGSALGFPTSITISTTAPNPRFVYTRDANNNLLVGPFTVGALPYLGYGVFPARNTTTEIEFTNFVYRPAILKLCKSAIGGVSGNFTFTLAPVDPLTTWPFGAGGTTSVTIPAGSCTFVNGPFPTTVGFTGVGTFNFGTSITVTETAQAGVSLVDITSPTLTGIGGVPNFNGTLTKDIANRKATFTLNHVSGIPVPPLNPTSFYFNELNFINGPAQTPPPAARARFDFDGDHRSDIAVFRPTDGTWYYSPSSAGGVRGVQFGANGDIPMSADYDGDGRSDPAVFRPSTGTWYILGSTNGFSAMQFGMSSDIPAAADFDGDGRADVAVFRPSSGTWYIMGSTNGFSGVQFGMNGDVPVAADFDGDGRADVSVFRPSSGTWYMLRSTAGFTGVQFGMNGDIPVGADYDGDGRADAAVFRPSNGTWYMLGSTAGFSGVQFGMAGDTPVPADYDGDGRTDVGVYRGSDRTWYILNSSQSGNAVGGLSAMQFGANGDQLMRY